MQTPSHTIELVYAVGGMCLRPAFGSEAALGARCDR